MNHEKFIVALFAFVYWS